MSSDALWIRGGTVVTAESETPADLWIADGTIRAVGTPEALSAAGMPPGTPPLDAAGCLVFPGFIDPHVHAHLPLPATSARSTYANTSRAALYGGTTTIMDFAGSGLEPDLPTAWSAWRTAAEGQSSCDWHWHVTVTHWNARVRRHLERLVREEGVTSLKIYLAYKPTLAISDEDLYQVLMFANAFDLTVLCHCENAALVPALQRRLLIAGKTGPEWHEPSRPPMVEAEGVTRFLTFAAATGARPYVVHVSSREALDAAERFRGRVRDLRLETMIHYLLLDSTCTARPDFEGAKWVLSPPLRTPDDQAALWAALADGRIDTLATDHCPFDYEGQKTLGRGDFSKIPNGIGGVEERIELALTHGVLAKKLTARRLVEVASANPAKIFGLYPRKGTIAPGSDADLAIWDPAGERTIANATQHLGTDYNPYEGLPLRGHFRAVLLRGTPMVRDGRFTAPEGQGIRV
ncbi:MAG: dihydropyrimidinase [Kiritimatiellae bacterium]|nr:dihydropyrimidinase [Kiritimatiellia bacterium]